MIHSLPRVCVCLSLTILCLAVGPAMAASVTLAVPAAELSEQAEADVAIALRDCQGLGALQLELTYPPELLEFRSASAGPLAGGAFADSNPVKAGVVKLALIGGEPINGNGVVINVRFKATGKGGSAGELRIQDARAWEHGNNLDMRVAVEPGQIKIKPRLSDQSAGGGLWAWLIAGVGLIGLAIVIIVTSRRKTSAG